MMKSNLKYYVKNGIVSTVIFFTSIVLAVIAYIIIFVSFDEIWAFAPIFSLCFVTFVAGIGILVGALLNERAIEDNAAEAAPEINNSYTPNM